MSLLQKRNDHLECRALFWCEPTDGESNGNGHLSEAIVFHVFAQRDRTLLDRRDQRQRWPAIRSVLHVATLQESFSHDRW